MSQDKFVFKLPKTTLIAFLIPLLIFIIRLLPDEKFIFWLFGDALIAPGFSLLELPFGYFSIPLLGNVAGGLIIGGLLLLVALSIFIVGLLYRTPPKKYVNFFIRWFGGLIIFLMYLLIFEIPSWYICSTKSNECFLTAFAFYGFMILAFIVTLFEAIAIFFIWKRRKNELELSTEVAR